MCVASSIEAYGVSAGQRIHPAVRRQGVGLPRAQSRKRGDIAAIGRQLGYLLAADEAADLIGLGLDLQGVRFHRHRLLRASDLQRYILFEGLSNIYDDVGFAEFLKTLHGCFQRIPADTYVREAINARCVRRDLPYLAGREILERNADIGNQPSAGIRHGSAYRGVILPPSPGG